MYTHQQETSQANPRPVAQGFDLGVKPFAIAEELVSHTSL